MKLADAHTTSILKFSVRPKEIYENRVPTEDFAGPGEFSVVCVGRNENFMIDIGWKAEQLVPEAHEYDRIMTYGKFSDLDGNIFYNIIK